MEKLHSEKILGVRVDFGLNMSDVVSKIDEMLGEKNEAHYICTTNAEFIMEARSDSKFKSIINDSSLSIPDGVGVLFAHKYLSSTKDVKNPLFKLLIGLSLGLNSFYRDTNLGDKISGVDLSYELMKLADKKGYSVFLLGGWPTDYWGKPIQNPSFDMATLAAEKIKKDFPNVNIIGASSAFKRDEKDDEKTVEYIHQCMKESNVKKLDLLLVAYNHNYQERWFVRNAKKIPAIVGVGLGGTFDYISGYLQRPTSYKFEWLKKFFMRPYKMSRILRAFPIFPILVFIDSIRKK